MHIPLGSKLHISFVLCYRPGTNDVTVSLLKRAKANGYSALVVTLDTPMIGWRPHDLDDAYLPFIHGVGCQIGLTDPVFMGLHGEKPDSRDDYPKHPYDWKAFDAAAMSGDAKTLRRVELSVAWLAETSRGLYRNWDDLEFLRKHWDGPIVLKGIQSIQVRVSSYVTSPPPLYLLSSRMLEQQWTEELTELLFLTTVRSR